MSKATEAGKVTEFTERACQILDAQKRLIAVGSRVGSLYYLDYEKLLQQANTAEIQSMENVWHRRFGHLGIESLHQLVRDEMVDGLDVDLSKKADKFCEACTEGKHHRSPFHSASIKHSKQPLELVQ